MLLILHSLGDPSALFLTIQVALSTLISFWVLARFGTHYRFQLVLQGAKHYLGVSSHRKHPLTPELLLQVFPLFQLDKP